MGSLNDDELLEVLDYWISNKTIFSRLQVPKKFEFKISRSELMLQIFAELGVTSSKKILFPEISSLRTKIKKRIEENPKMDLINNDGGNNFLSLFFNFWPELQKILDSFLNRILPNFNRPKNFWELFGLSLILILIYVGFFPIEFVILSALSILVFKILSANTSIIWKFLSPTQRKKNFLNKLEDKNISEIKNFIRSSKLNFEDLKIISASKHGKHPEVISEIVNYQDYDYEFIEFLDSKQLLQNLSSKQISTLILYSETMLLDKLRKKFFQSYGDRVKGSIIVSSGSFVKQNNIPQIVFTPLIYVTRLVKYLVMKKIITYLIFLISLSLVIFSVIINRSYSLIYIKSDIFLTFFSIISLLQAILIVTFVIYFLIILPVYFFINLFYSISLPLLGKLYSLE